MSPMGARGKQRALFSPGQLTPGSVKRILNAAQGEKKTRAIIRANKRGHIQLKFGKLTRGLPPIKGTFQAGQLGLGFPTNKPLLPGSG